MPQPPNPKPKPDSQLDLIIVVSGQPQPVTGRGSEPLRNLVREALALTGNAGQAPEDWELRREDGSLLDQDTHLRDAHLSDGTTLFLNPHAGAGGC